MTDLPTVSLALDNQLCFKLYAASRAVTRAYKPMLDQLGLTYPQYVVMLVLWEWHHATPPQPTVKALGERLMLDSGTLTPLLKRLEQLGLVRRQRSAQDEREVHLSLSHAGVQLRGQAHQLKTRLLCDSGVDLNQADALREGLDQLLAQIRDLSS
ncbi:MULTISPECIES: MarR family winged helix-turn-helix transcriptional regulator [Pseudomonas]|jgi:MarR family transcriptional regulator, organic hydroperoxide resistance regulator|uniref:MarR family transcriptional regulator n=1 Tax=Pseudomonas veronii TaxID=76761 RepID=A0A0R3BKQ0_PSEVE|nr:MULTISPECIES: MarR family transcriptional regulator [Pseudomonas]SEC12604.1 DNA-binding transcriptional regulator, MarR family [Pseudomonas marginalis]AQY65189.1 MarR family transcriptional regulator [Pseudomonas veronii]KRP83556.1 MarR family transcriptional regulator [Pseudomonas veronii]MBI6552199.1 MarR family transcriptional regulator [Pseudomonas veronii]MBI6651237.1 MarR family transcriptional regulator [Pseudomonas veronii]